MAFAYYNCQNLTGTITIPNSVTNLQETFATPGDPMDIFAERDVINIDVILPSKWQGNPQVMSWSSCVNSVTYQ
jgi:hypothetical protein